MKDFLLGCSIVSLILGIAYIAKQSSTKEHKTKVETYCIISIFTNDSTVLKYTANSSKVNIRNGAILFIDDQTGKKVISNSPFIYKEI